MLNNLKKLVYLFSRRDLMVFSVLIILTIIGSLMEIVGLGIIPVFVDLLANPQRVLSYRTVARILTRFDLVRVDRLVYFGSVSLMIIFAVKNAFLIFNRYVQLRVLKNRQKMLMGRLFRAYMNAPFEFHLQRNTAELQRNVNGETQAICQQVLSALMGVFMSAIMTLGILLMLAYVNVWITLVVIFVMSVAGGGLLLRFQNKVKTLGKQAQIERREIFKTVNQGLGSIKELRLMGREDFFVRDLGVRANSLAVAQTYQEIIGSTTVYYMESVAVVTLLLVCILLVAIGKPIDSIAPVLSLFAVALVRIKAAVSAIVGGINTLLFQSHCVVPVYEDLKALEKPHRIVKHESDNPLSFRSAIELQEVNYRYPSGHRNVLNNVNMLIEKGSSVAFIGPTGAGKTTLVDVLLGLLPPTSGAVMVDGVNIRDSLPGWQRNIGYVPQVIYLTDDTIRRNIALGLFDHEIDDEKVWGAVCSAQLEEFVNSLPQGLDTFVGERGMRISGGQRQRIGIARALYHNPDVLVLDEGTSALDNQTEAAVIEAVDKMKGTRTIIMIAHRLTTVAGCDLVYKIEMGNLMRQNAMNADIL